MLKIEWLISSQVLCVRVHLKVHIMYLQRACTMRIALPGLCVCLPVCLSATSFSAIAYNNTTNSIYQQLQWDVFKMVFSLVVLCSGITAMFAYAAKFYTYERAHTGTQPRGFYSVA